MDGLAMPVIIIVKAPNQQIEDQTVHCELNWTIKKLKGHLSEVYPSKPRSEDQKLIYSGQLLVDTVQLKDVLRSYDGQENHTVHLVCSPPKEGPKMAASSSSTPLPSAASTPTGASATSISASSSNSSISSGSSSSRQSAAQNLINTVPSREERRQEGDPRALWAAAASAAYPAAYNGNNMAHQMAWMQQAYNQYVTNYMQFLASTQGGINNTYPVYTGLTAPTPMQQPGPAREDNQPAANNQAAAGVDGEEDEGRGHRDWLDWFYIMSRVLVLFSVVYFYSSPVRFFMVSTLGMIMYLYQVGFFRMQGMEGRGENLVGAAGGERENNNIGPAPVPVATAAATQQDGDGDTPPPQPQEPERPSFLTLTWTILCSFLLSLIPEQPNVI